jgi:hypothetical protein
VAKLGVSRRRSARESGKKLGESLEVCSLLCPVPSWQISGLVTASFSKKTRKLCLSFEAECIPSKSLLISRHSVGSESEANAAAVLPLLLEIGSTYNILRSVLVLVGSTLFDVYDTVCSRKMYCTRPTVQQPLALDIRYWY